MALSGGHLIDGKWRRDGGGGFNCFNPATGEALEPKFAEAAKEQVDAAMHAAPFALHDSASLEARWPARLLDSIAECILKLGDSLLDRAGAETALPNARLISERARTVGQLAMFAQLVKDGAWVDAVIDTADPSRKPIPKPDIRRMFRPRGTVVVLGASNFPFAFGVVGGDTAAALAVGNPVIVKGHPSHPGTSELLASAVLEALESQNLPRGLFALLQGRSHELSAQLVTHAETRAVGFTGSRQAGRALFDLAAARPEPIPVYAEMGSLNPVVILPGAIRDRAQAIARELCASILLGGGQFCTKPGVILVFGPADPFVNTLQQQISATGPVTMLNQPMRDSLAARVLEWSKIPGVDVLTASSPSGFASVSPALFHTRAAVFMREPHLQEEAFGPAAVVVECSEIDDAQSVLRCIGGSLTGTIHIGPDDDAKPILSMMQELVGRIVVNGYPTGVEVCDAMMHGGPYPATTDASMTSVGAASIRRFVRAIAYQNIPDDLLPPALQNANPLGIERTINGQRTKARIEQSRV